jgi:hypothetical protein
MRPNAQTRELAGAPIGGQYAAAPHLELVVDLAPAVLLMAGEAGALQARTLALAAQDAADEGSHRDAAGFYAGKSQAGADIAHLLGHPDLAPDGSLDAGAGMLAARAAGQPLPPAVPLTEARAAELAGYALSQTMAAHETTERCPFPYPTDPEVAQRTVDHFTAVGRRETYARAWVELTFPSLTPLRTNTLTDQVLAELALTEDGDLEVIARNVADLEEPSEGDDRYDRREPA